MHIFDLQISFRNYFQIGLLSLFQRLNRHVTTLCNVVVHSVLVRSFLSKIPAETETTLCKTLFVLIIPESLKYKKFKVVKGEEADYSNCPFIAKEFRGCYIQN